MPKEFINQIQIGNLAIIEKFLWVSHLHFYKNMELQNDERYKRYQNYKMQNIKQ